MNSEQTRLAVERRTEEPPPEDPTIEQQLGKGLDNLEAEYQELITEGHSTGIKFNMAVTDLEQAKHDDGGLDTPKLRRAWWHEWISVSLTLNALDNMIRWE
jgi:hypothetical protein